jgi:drug/metabolite transporter (DMT)-like permease
MERGHAITGILFAVLAYGLFSIHDASIKLLVEQLPVWQVLFVRSVIIIVASLAIGRRPLLERAIATPLKGAMALRGVLTLAAWICYFTASRHLALGQMTALYFAAPLIITLLAAPLLKEEVTPARWVAVGIGFAGVMFASDPFGVRPGIPALLVLIAAALWGYGVILMRKIARRETSLLQMLSANIVFMLGTGAACAFDWSTPVAWQIALMTGVGVVGGLAQFFTFEAARLAPASVMATMEYTSLLWAFLLGYAIWGSIPPTAVFAGAALILMAGILLVGTEWHAIRRPEMAGREEG